MYITYWNLSLSLSLSLEDNFLLSNRRKKTEKRKISKKQSDSSLEKILPRSDRTKGQSESGEALKEQYEISSKSQWPGRKKTRGEN